ncbi:MAG: rRNA pseudouridine synthase [Alphaproteobacteria bacterium]|nr:rRNA pseudouridine synthase [Alphaproteobacteria bacterium]MCB9791756.1 rRNA pseudouridine synthase [Alphaproteobacteria bacterium]
MSQQSTREQRVSKLIAARGLASRREAEDLIRDGRVEVNGERIEHPGTKVVLGEDEVRVDGQALPAEPERVYLLMYKPRGCITGRRDPQGRKSVLDLLDDVPERVEPVGRLDYDTEGALLLTNDGDLAYALTHPSKQAPRRYLAKVWRTPDERTLVRLRRGVHLEDGNTGPAKVRVLDATDGGNAWVEVTVTEGRNRLIRRMFQAVNHPVAKLRRESFATLSIRGMERGEVRPVTAEELARLRDIAEGVNANKAGRRFRRREGFAKAKPKKRRGAKKRFDSRRGRS